MNKIAVFLLVVDVVLLAIDAWQTRYIALHPESHSEINVILGRHPSVAKVCYYFAACIVLFLVAAWWMLDQGKYLYFMLGAGFLGALETWCIIHNWRAGIPFLYAAGDK